MAAENADVGQTAMSADQLAGHLEELMKRIKARSWTGRHFRAVQEGRNPFALPATAPVDICDRVLWWSAHFRKLYRINPDFSSLYIPEHPTGFDRLVIVPKGLTHRKWVEAASAIHAVELYNQDMDSCVVHDDRTPKDRSYGIWIRDRQEADEELKNLSADALKEQEVSGITLLEREVAGTGYLFDEQCHMDVENVTLCSGSRCSGGDVPSVHWNVFNRRLYVGWADGGYANDDLRTRAVVS